eukprot:gene20004-39589_t
MHGGPPAPRVNLHQSTPVSAFTVHPLAHAAHHTEGAALLQYVADLDPARALIGQPGSRERLAVLEWLTYISTELHKGFSPWLWHKETADSTRQAARAKLATRFAELDAVLSRSDFLAGAYSVADAYGFTIVNWSNLLGIPLTAYPHLQAWMARVAARPQVQAALQAAAGLTLVSHALCPYVQRVAIVLHEKGLAFERRTIDLAHKPDWFLALSPLGKTPVLQVRGQSLFESAVICEYLDEVATPALHPQDPLQRARHRAWMEFGSAVLGSIGAFYSAPDEATLQARAHDLRGRFGQIEDALGQRNGPGPYFAGPDFGMVDAVFGPVF